MYTLATCISYTIYNIHYTRVYQVLVELAQTEVSCREYAEKHEQGEGYIKTLRQQKKSLELVTCPTLLQI